MYRVLLEVVAWNFCTLEHLLMYRESNPMAIQARLHLPNHHPHRWDMEACVHHYVREHRLYITPKIPEIFHSLEKKYRINWANDFSNY